MPKTISTPEPKMNLCYKGENYFSDEQGQVSVPDEAAKHFIESHGCTDPAKAHPHGLKIKGFGAGKFAVLDPDDHPVHGGYLDQAGAFAIMRAWQPMEPAAEEADEAPTKKNGKKNS